MVSRKQQQHERTSRECYIYSPLIGNHVQPCPARDQDLPGSPHGPPTFNLISQKRARRESLVLEVFHIVLSPMFKVLQMFLYGFISSGLTRITLRPSFIPLAVLPLLWTYSCTKYSRRTHQIYCIFKFIDCTVLVDTLNKEHL